MHSEGGFKKQIHFLIFSLLVSAGIFGYLFSKVSLAEVLDIFRNISMVWVALFLLFSFSGSFFRTWRYQLILNVSGYQVDSVPLFLITLVRNFFSDLLPARLGTLIYVYLVKSRMGLPLGPILSSFAHAFLFDIISLAFLLLPALAFTALAARSALALAAAAVLLGLAGFAVLVLLPTCCRLGATIAGKLTFLPQKWRDGLLKMLAESEEHLRLARSRGVYWRLLALSFGVRACKYLSFYLLFLGLMLPLGYVVADFPLEKVFLGLCSAELAASLPISGIAGFGAYEGAWALVFQLLGYPERLAVLSSISHHLFTQVYGYILGAAALLVLLLPLFSRKGYAAFPPENIDARRFWMKFLATVLTIGLMTFLLLPAGDGQTAAGGRPAQLSQLPEGKLVYERADGIYLKNLDSPQGTLLAAGGRHPRWSPDGRLVVYILDTRIMVADAAAGTSRTLVEVDSPGTVCFGADGRSVLYADGRSMFRIRLDGKDRREIASDGVFLESSLSSSGERLAATVKSVTGYRVKAFDLKKGSVRTVSKGCSASISPDGRLVTVLGSKHRLLHLHDWQTLAKTGQVEAPAGTRFDNQFWSNNPDWLVSTQEGKRHDILLHHVPSGGYRKVTFSGDADRADVHIRP